MKGSWMEIQACVFLTAQDGAELVGRVISEVIEHRVVSLWLCAVGILAIIGLEKAPMKHIRLFVFFSANEERR